MPFGSSDPEVQLYLQRSQRLLITDNRASMPGHLQTHWQQGNYIWGLLWTRPHTPMRILAQELVLIWEATAAEEWRNVLDWIPF